MTDPIVVARPSPVPGRPLRWPRLFATDKDEPRARRATDVIVLVAAGALLVAASLAAQPAPGWITAFDAFLASFPGVLTPVWQVAADLLVVLAALLIVGAAVRGRLTLVRDAGLALGLAVVLGVVVARIVVDDWPSVVDALRADGPPGWYPSLRIAVPAAVVMTTAPHMSRPVRRLGRWIVWLAMIGTALLGASDPLGVVAGVLVAAVASSAVHLLMGSCDGRPSLDAVKAALAELGVGVREVGVADRQEAGLFLAHAIHDNGDGLDVKVYGRDAYDSALLSTVWRKTWYRDAGAPMRLGRLAQVEHEAFVTLYAQQAGISTDTVVTAGATADDDALLVLRRLGTPLRDVLDGRPATAEEVRAVWDVVERLGAARIAHGQLDDRHLLVQGDALGVAGFRGASVSATEPQLRTDQAQALVTTVLIADDATAIDVAASVLGADGLAAVLPYVQLPSMTSDQRRRLREQELDLDTIRERIATTAGIEPPKLQQLRRITIGSIIRVVLPAIAVVALYSAVSDLDIDQVVDSLRDANWAWIVLGALIAQTPRLTQAISTMGASPVPLPLGPTYALQLAISYVNLAIPTSASRIAVNIRFFQLHGVPPGGALAAGALDGFSGFIVQLTVLLLVLVLTPMSLDLSLDGETTSGIGRLVGLVLLIAVVAIVVVLVVPSLRRKVVTFVRGFTADAVEALRGLQSPRRLAMLFGGNLASEVLFAISLLVFVRAFGVDVGLGEVLLINIAVALFAGLMPIPGGIGVTEGGLIYGLTRAGVPDEVAFSAVVLYRLAAFYAPPIWGFFAMRWMERNHHL